MNDSDWIEKGINNADIVTRKFGPTSTRAINHRFEVAKEERRKRDEIVENLKTKVMAGRWERVREEIILSSKNGKSNGSDIGDEIDPDQADNEYLMSLWEAMGGKL